MRLSRLDIRGFGQLRGSYPLDVGPSRVALLIEDNEAGKSTLTAAIRAALYGLEGDKRRSPGRATELDRYRPWEGGAYGLSLRVQTGGAEIVVERDFDQGSVRVLRGGEDITQEFQSEGRVQVGERLVGLSRTQFELSTFVGQGDIVFSEGADLSEALQRVTDSGDGTRTAAHAISVLDDALANYEGVTLKGRGRVDTEIKRCEEELEQARARLSELDAERAALGSKLESLHGDEARTEQYARQRRMLRQRRRIDELAEARAAVDADRSLEERVAAMRAQVDREAGLRSLEDSAVAAVDAARRKHDEARARSEERQRAAQEAEERRQQLDRKRASLAFTRRPTEQDRDALVRAIQHRNDLEQARASFEREYEREADELATRGVSVQAAEELDGYFRKLDDRDRDIVERRGTTTVRFAEQREELETELSERKRRRAEIRGAQHARKRFGIWCLVVGMLPVMIAITAFSALPFSPMILHGLGAAFGVVGVTLFIVGQNTSRKEDERLRERLAELREQLTGLSEDELAGDRAWNTLAERLGLSPGSLAERYRDWRRVERAVDTVARLRDRIDQARAQEGSALDGATESLELFNNPPEPDALEGAVDEIAAGIELHRAADAAEALAQDRRRAADESKNEFEQESSALREATVATGLQLDEDESLESAYERLQQRAEAARAARRRAEEELPALEARLDDPADRAGRRDRLETLSAEVEAEHAELAPMAAAEGWDALDQGLDAVAYERAAARIDEEERAQRANREGDRVEATSFLARYEQEAPALRVRIEEVESAHARATAFRDSVSLARTTLDGIARETHHDWARDLNDRLADMLAALGSEVRDAQLDDQLRLHLTRSGRTLTGQDARHVLSVGAIEGVYLAVRIARSRALSGDTRPLPLVLDDPFANADDGRLVQGLELLIDSIAPRQQVLLLACQKSRYEWAKAQLRAPDRVGMLRGGAAVASD